MGSSPALRQYSIPFFVPSVGEAEIEAVLQTLRSGWLTTGGEMLTRVSPIDGELIARIQQATDDDYEAVVATARVNESPLVSWDGTPEMRTLPVATLPVCSASVARRIVGSLAYRRSPGHAVA